MSIFAVRVCTGQEIKVKHILVSVLERQTESLVKAIHAFETFTQKFCGENSATKHFKSVVPGYIFVELDQSFHNLPADLWHLIKSIPMVYQVIKDNIPQDEFDQFFESVDTEPEVEVAVSQVESEDKPEITEADFLQEDNTSTTTENPKRYFNDLKSVRKTLLDRFNEIKQVSCDNPNLAASTKRCKAYIRQNKEVFIFPFSLFHKTRERVDPFKRMTVRNITKGSFIIPELLKTLQMQIQHE